MSKRTIKLCSIDGCERKHLARGWCRNHYYGWKRNGDPLVVKRATRSPLCSIEGCGNKHKAYGWCENHFKRWQRHGNPEGGIQHYRTAEESFSARTQWDGECLVWTGYKNDGGYGIMKANGSIIRAHRYAWERRHGEIPDDMEIDHICHNRACVNVKHLRIASPQQNNFNLSGPHSNSRSGARNVHWSRSGWIVKVQRDYVKHYFGSYKTIEEAAVVAEQARKDLFGDYAGKG